MKNEYRVTWKRYRSWIIENMFKDTNLVLMFLWCAIACACFAAEFVIGAKGFFIFVALFCIYRAFFRNLLIGKKYYNRMTSHYKTKDWLRRIEFQEDGISLYEESTFMKFDYDRIVKIREKGDQISLYMDDKSVLRLYHSTFVDGDWDGCRKMMDAHPEKKRDQIRQERECDPQKFSREKMELEERLRKRIGLMLLAIFLFAVCVTITVWMNLKITNQSIDPDKLEMIECDVTRVVPHKYKTSTVYDYYVTYQGEERKLQVSDYSLKKGMHINAYLYNGKLYASELSIKTNTGISGFYYVFLVIDAVAFYFVLLGIAYVKQDLKKRKEFKEV